MPSATPADARDRGTFVRHLTFRDSVIAFDGQITRIIDAWVERDAHAVYRPLWFNGLTRLNTYSVILNVVYPAAGSATDSDATEQFRRRLSAAHDTGGFTVRFRDSTQPSLEVVRAISADSSRQLVVPLGRDPRACSRQPRSTELPQLGCSD
jgi:hypothetical protein